VYWGRLVFHTVVEEFDPEYPPEEEVFKEKKKKKKKTQHNPRG
jgi:hypothetical protein